jgi:hypothetical protein
MKHLTLILCTCLALVRANATDYSKIAPRLEAIAREEMREWESGGIAVVLVDDRQVVYANGFGEAKRDSLSRVGSISKIVQRHRSIAMLALSSRSDCLLISLACSRKRRSSSSSAASSP